jgi:hypothetical protein
VAILAGSGPSRIRQSSAFITEDALAMLQLEGFPNLRPRYAGVMDT